MKIKNLLFPVFLFAVLVLCQTNAISQNTWTQKASFTGGGRETATAFSIEVKGYFGLGNNTNITTWYNDFWEWNPGTNVWTQKANFPGAARGKAVGFAIGTKGYVGTGAYNIGSTTPSDWIRFNDFWEFDPSLNTWVQKTNFPGVARYDAVGFSIGKKGYIGTGFDATSNYKDFWEWDQATDTWTQKADFTTSRREAVGLSIGNKGYIATGYDVAMKNDFWEWDPTTNVWTQKATFGGTPRYNAVAFSSGGKGYIGTGYDGSFRDDFWEWDPVTNVWTARAAFGGAPRFDAAGFSIGSKGYIATGGSILFPSYSQPFESDLWEYAPLNMAVTEYDLYSNISILPNPSNGFMKLRAINAQLLNQCVVEIINEMGQKICFDHYEADPFNIDISSQPAGMYFLKITSLNGSSTTKKIIKK